MTSIGFDSRFDGHSQAQPTLGALPLLESDFHRHALHHLDVVTRGVLGREQAELRSARPGDALDVAIVFAPVGVDVNLDGLAGSHVLELSLFEISRYPD